LITREEEILTILAEECSEVIQVIQKIKRFGWGEGEYDNSVKLKQEIADTILAIKLVFDYNIVNEENMLELMQAKRKKLQKFSTNLKVINESERVFFD
jgi:NTP pyrophosphatase (non-canonical NTP hydrolase)